MKVREKEREILFLERMCLLEYKHQPVVYHWSLSLYTYNDRLRQYLVI
jgi:hypothetical protein